ncbi:MAG: flagellin lysine-N-methylase [Lachnospiraceae bacterium]|nr:flagellin lysine-N-methylase [Lachnospiraceae bacterium]
MRIRRISFYDAFDCEKGACEESCCRAWSIPVDDEALARFRKERGLLRLRLFLAVRGREEKILNPARGRCIFFRRDGLCDLQCKKGASYVPYTCRVYPRRHVRRLDVAEETLDLSCIAAARLFLASSMPLVMTETKGSVSYGRRGTNRDKTFLEGLVSSLDRLTRLLQEEETGVDEALRRALALAVSFQSRAVHGKDPFAGEDGDRIFDQTLFPLDIALLNEWVNGCLYTEDIRRRLPFLYRLFRMYFRHFDGLNVTQGKRHLSGLYASFEASGLADSSKYKKYAAYMLMRTYTETQEDYSFVRRLTDCVMHVNLIYLFDALYAEEKGTLSLPEQAHIIAVYEKRVLHNAGVQKDMHAKWEGRLFPADGVTYGG